MGGQYIEEVRGELVGYYLGLGDEYAEGKGAKTGKGIWTAGVEGTYGDMGGDGSGMLWWR